MMEKRIAAVLALVALMLLGASPLFAQEKAREQAKVREKVIVKKIGGEAKEKLTEEQKAKLEELRKEHRLRSVELRADLTKLGVALKREMDKPEPNKQEIEAVLKKMSAVREKLQMNRIEQVLAVRKLLGDDWRKRMRVGGLGRSTMRIEAEIPGFDEEGESDIRIFRSPSRDRLMMRPGAVRKDARTFGRGDIGRWSPIVASRMGGDCCSGACRAMMHKAPGRAMKHKARGRAMMHKESCGSGAGHAKMHKESCGHGAAVKTKKGGCGTGGEAHKSCSGACRSEKSKWESRMFRPRGKKTEAHRCEGSCKHTCKQETKPAGRSHKEAGGH